MNFFEKIDFFENHAFYLKNINHIDTFVKKFPESSLHDFVSIYYLYHQLYTVDLNNNNNNNNAIELLNNIENSILKLTAQNDSFLSNPIQGLKLIVAAKRYEIYERNRIKETKVLMDSLEKN